MNGWSRWVQFWPGIGAWYGDIALIMKPTIQKLPWVNWGPNVDYFFKWDPRVWWQVKPVSTETYFNSVVDFTHQRVNAWDNPNVNVPYLSIGADNAWVWAKNSVSLDMIEAVTLPEHVISSPAYNDIIVQLQQKGIKIIEVKTGKSPLEYAWVSIVNAKSFRTWNELSIFGKQIMAELQQKYPSLSYEDACCAYLAETKWIAWTFTEIQKKYNDEIAVQSWLSRWSFAWGQYQNYVSQANYTKEQQVYFEYVLAKQAAKRKNSSFSTTQ